MRTCHDCTVVLTVDNTYISKSRIKYSYCRECQKKRSRAASARRRVRLQANKLCFCGSALDNANLKWQCTKCSMQLKKQMKEAHLHKKRLIVNHYGGKCSCCGETIIEFLSVDHINGGGLAHRKSMGSGSSSLYNWIVKHNFPNDLRIMCHNCNLGRHIAGGTCPHQSHA